MRKEKKKSPPAEDRTRMQVYTLLLKGKRRGRQGGIGFFIFKQGQGTLQLVMLTWLVVISPRSATSTPGTAVQLACDRIRDVAELLLLLIKVFSRCCGRILF